MSSSIDLILKNANLILIVNKDFDIIYNSRYDKKMCCGKQDYDWNKNQVNLFEKYPTLDRYNSSIAKTMSTGEVIINDAQEFADSDGKVYVTQNITFPIYTNGRICGVIELTKDLTTVEHVNSKKQYFDMLENETSFHSNRENNADITFDDILTLDTEMLNAIEKAKVFAIHKSPTLIYGETGTGKELFAQAMINYAATPKQKIVVQNCAAVPENLIESILFGATKGSYTGAENKKGLFEEADGGIFFLDELNALPYGVQGKLLRVVQDGTFRPIGSNREKKVSVKIIAAMNIDPMTAIEHNVLRKDLFYRLSSNMIYIPPLRERKKDIEYLTDYYIDYYDHIYGRNVTGISEELRRLLLKYSWDGNVRELMHVIESMVSLSRESTLTVSQLPLYLHNKIVESDDLISSMGQETITDPESVVEVEMQTSLSEENDDDYDLKKALEKVEKRLIISTLKKVNGNKTKAGKLLGIPRQTLKYKMNKWGIEDSEE